MIDLALLGLIGETGFDALRTAEHSLRTIPSPPAEAIVSWAAWTEREWSFTFVQRHPPRRLVVDVPHDGSEVNVRVRSVSDRPGSGPLAD